METNKKIIGIVGTLASGKTTVAAYLEEKYSAKTFRFSTMLRDILGRVYIEVTRGNMQKLSTFLRQTYGEDIMSQTIAKDVQNATAAVVVTEGIRRPTDITYLKELPGFHLVSLDADPQIRFNRIKERGENEDDKNKTFEQFLEDEKQEADILINEIAKDADTVITNNGTFEELYAHIDELIKKL